MEFIKKLQDLDRRWIYLIVALAIVIPLLIPFNAPTYTTSPTEKLYQMIDSYSEREDRAILICFAHDASTMAELYPMEVAILRHCFERDVKVFTLTFLPTAAPLINYAIDMVKEEYPEIQSGTNYINIGYKPGALYLPIVVGMGDNIAEAVETDAEGRKLESLPMMKGLTNYNELKLVIETSGASFAGGWITYARARYGVNVAAGVTAVMAADAYPYLQTGQLTGMLSGMKGAAEYEYLTDVFAAYSSDDYPNGRPFSKQVLKDKEEISKIDIAKKYDPETKTGIMYKWKTARLGMNAQSVAHMMIFIFILIGNIGFFIDRHQQNKEKK
ncbi:MAG: hypothetical protein JXR56_03735 [Candidatus Cloacimonetes bacterium]|nr:hypothetical protein [Candidatus Cloacimonadota bacterium]